MKRKRTLLTVVITAVLVSLFGLHWNAPAQTPQGWGASTYTYISTATTTIVKPVGGFLNTVTINGGTAGVVTLYDIGAAGCTGTPASGKFATIETIGTTNPVTLGYNLQTKNGICVVTAAATDVTVAYN